MAEKVLKFFVVIFTKDMKVTSVTSTINRIGIMRCGSISKLTETKPMFTKGPVS